MILRGRFFENRVDEAIQKYKDAKAGEEVWYFIDTMIDIEKMIGQEIYRRREYVRRFEIMGTGKSG